MLFYNPKQGFSHPLSQSMSPEQVSGLQAANAALQAFVESKQDVSVLPTLSVHADIPVIGLDPVLVERQGRLERVLHQQTNGIVYLR